MSVCQKLLCWFYDKELRRPVSRPSWSCWKQPELAFVAYRVLQEGPDTETDLLSLFSVRRETLCFLLF